MTLGQEMAGNCPRLGHPCLFCFKNFAKDCWQAYWARKQSFFGVDRTFWHPMLGDWLPKFNGTPITGFRQDLP